MPNFKKIAKKTALAVFIFLFFIIAAGQYALAEGGYLKKKIAQVNQLKSIQNYNQNTDAVNAIISNDSLLSATEKKIKLEEAVKVEEAKRIQQLEEAKRRAEAETLLAEAAKQKAEENARLAEIAKQQADESVRLAEENKKKQLEQARLAEENSKKIVEQARLAEIENQKNIEKTKEAEVKLKAEVEELKRQAQEALGQAEEKRKREEANKVEEELNLIQQTKQQAVEQAAQSKKQVTEAVEQAAQSKKQVTEAVEQAAQSKVESTRAQEDLDRANKDSKKADLAVRKAEVLVERVNNVSENNLQELQNISKSTGVELVDKPVGAAAADGESRLSIKQLAGKSMVMKATPLSSAEAQKPEVTMTNIDKDVILKPTVQEIDIFNNNNPLAKTDKLVGLTFLASIETENKNQAEISPGIMLLDSDGDGLSDDMEKRIGTDPYNADTDGDGYSDYVEIKNGYNPLGKGKKDADMKPAEKAIVNRVAIEQPKSSAMAASNNLMVKKIMTGHGEIIAEAGIIGAALNSSVKDLAADQDGKLKFEGVAAPDDVVLLFIYSEMPIVVTMNTDKNGNWVYDLDKTLVSGDHEAYVVVMDEKGKIRSKSSPLAFFVKEAQAVTLAEEDSADSNLVATPDDSQSDNMIIWYVFYSGILISLLFAAYLFFSRDSKE